jgi:hypothetical protein
MPAAKQVPVGASDNADALPIPSSAFDNSFPYVAADSRPPLQSTFKDDDFAAAVAIAPTTPTAVRQMTNDEFKDHYDKAMWQLRLRMFLILIFGFAPGIALGAALDLTPGKKEIILLVLFGVPMFLFLVGSLAALFWTLYIVPRTYCPKCPDCTKWISGWYKNKVLKTGYCPHCKGNILLPDSA